MTAVAEKTDCWLDQLRESALERFTALGFPTTRQEDWRFTNVAPIARTSFEPAPAATADPQTLPPFTSGARLVFVNGRLQTPIAALPAGVGADTLTEEASEYLGRYASF